MNERTEPVIHPYETHNILGCLAIIVGLIWIFTSCRRCWAVVQLRRALGSRRLVAIRGAGSRVRIFRLLTRNYLQRNLARNHLQALVHTRQAYPPKTMPCALLLATPVNPTSGGVRATLHPRGGADLPSPLSVAMTRKGIAGVSHAGGGISREGSKEAGALVGVSVELDCRVECTVELLWDVDLALLAKEMGLPPKLHLLPPPAIPEGNVDHPAGTAPANAPGGVTDTPSRGRNVINIISDGGGGMWRALAWLASAVGSRRGSTAARGNRRGVGARVAGANRPQQQQQQQQQQPQRQQGEEGAADGTHRSDSVGDEEMGGREAAGHGGDGGEHFFVGGEVEAAGGFSSGSTSGLSGSSYAGRDAGSTGVGRGVGGAAGPSWYAALGFRKPSGMDGGGREGVICASSGGGGGARLGHHGGGGIAGGDARSAGAADGYGKKTVRRSLPAGDGRVFEALPGESYFRVRAAEGPAARGNAASKVAGVAWPKPRPRPSIGDSLPAGRCSLAIVIRPAGAADTTGDWTRWRHRPTHRVTRQVLLVQLKEREKTPTEAQLLRPPSAQVLRHLVAISEGGQGCAESIYSFSEVYGMGDHGGTHQRSDPSADASAVDSAHATAGFGSDSTHNTSDDSGRQGAEGGLPPPRGGREERPPEECVICLTDPKTTLLLPCRHLCVCSECFRYVDKCPVCRAAFDNYVVLQEPPSPVEAAAAGEGDRTALGTSSVAVAADETAASAAAAGGADSTSEATTDGAGTERALPSAERRTIFAVSRRRPAAERAT